MCFRKKPVRVHTIWGGVTFSMSVCDFFFPLPFPKGQKEKRGMGEGKQEERLGRGERKGGKGWGGRKKLPEYWLEPVDALSVNPLFALVSYFYGGDNFITSKHPNSCITCLLPLCR